MAVAPSELYLGGAWAGLHGGQVPHCRGPPRDSSAGYHLEGEWARDLLEEKGLREGIYARV